MKFNYYTYIPRDKFKNLSEILQFKDRCGNIVQDSIKAFFGNFAVKEAVKEDDWQKVFCLWTVNGREHGNKPLWIDDILADFLYFADIDFWNYIPQNFDRWSWHIGYGISERLIHN